jgi:hypothetical protein
LPPDLCRGLLESAVRWATKFRSRERRGGSRSGRWGIERRDAARADTTTGYPAFIDTPSFVNQVILHELTRNLDAYTRSQYFYKDRDGKVNAGPLWDYDLIAGVGKGR